jgi:hypothetical protein
MKCETSLLPPAPEDRQADSVQEPDTNTSHFLLFSRPGRLVVLSQDCLLNMAKATPIRELRRATKTVICPACQQARETFRVSDPFTASQ